MSKKGLKGSFIYFAYGSNMNHQQMVDRCPTAKFIGKAFSKNYRFVYDGNSNKWNCAVANIVESAKYTTWGGLWKIGKKDVSALDRYEGYPNKYDRKKIDVQCDGVRYTAVVYFKEGQKEGPPSQEYQRMVIEGAHQCDLDECYIKQYIGTNVNSNDIKK